MYRRKGYILAGLMMLIMLFFLFFSCTMVMAMIMTTGCLMIALFSFHFFGFRYSFQGKIDRLASKQIVRWFQSGYIRGRKSDFYFPTCMPMPMSVIMTTAVLVSMIMTFISKLCISYLGVSSHCFE